MSSMERAVIVDALRTPIGRYGGALKDARPDDLAATVFHTLGIPLERELHDAQGRPLPLWTGRPVLGLF